MFILSWFFRPRSDSPGVYRIRNKVTNCVYIGGTTRPMKARWSQHIGNLKCNRHRNRRLQQDWNRYGANAFEFSVIEVIKDHDLIFERERYWQDKDYTREGRYNPKNEVVQRSYSAQGDRGLSIIMPEGFTTVEELIEYFSTHTLTDDEAIDFLSRFYRNGERLFSDKKIREFVGGRSF